MPTNDTNRSDAVNDGKASDDCDDQLALVNWMRWVMWLDDVTPDTENYLLSLHCCRLTAICCVVNDVPI